MSRTVLRCQDMEATYDWTVRVHSPHKGHNRKKSRNTQMKGMEYKGHLCPQQFPRITSAIPLKGAIFN